LAETGKPIEATDSRGGRVWLALGFYLAFVVYGSLVPLDFEPLSRDVAWRKFLETPYLTLGIESRADWVANILLYIPLAYLGSAAVERLARAAPMRLLSNFLIFAACVALAVGIEYVQLFFPPRTVSLNDIVAEIIGSALGIAFRLRYGVSIARVRTDFARGGANAVRAAATAYVLAYLAFSFFPYDLVVSASELASKFGNETFAWWLVPQTCGRTSLCLAKFAVEILAVMPIGVALGVALGRNHRRPVLVGVVAGFALGLVIEACQLFVASALSEGASVLTRALGVAAGVLLYLRFETRWLDLARKVAGPIVVTVAPFYLIGLAWANRWFTGGWTDIQGAVTNLPQVHWLPLYYHYFTSETQALQSLLANTVLYAPIGFAYWLWRR
jgi:VanZ family protein